jgi:hypothetical protein
MADEETKPAAPDLKLVPAKAATLSAAQRLRAFEDEVFGKKVSRINGEVERGIGSPYADMTQRQKAHYAALEKLVAAEKDMSDASAALAAAEAAHAAATKASDDAAKAMDESE